MDILMFIIVSLPFMRFSSNSVLKKNNVIISGRSSEIHAYASIPVSLHAEISALRHIPKSKHREEYNLLVLRISKTGALTHAKPCYHCIKQLMRATNIHIKNVFYTDDKPGIIQFVSFSELSNSVRNGTYTYISSGYRSRMNLSRKHKKGYNT